MSTYKENRRENLLALERKFGSLEALSDAVEVSASYLSQMKSLRHMGDKVARRFERKLGLPAGSMDQKPGEMQTVVSKAGEKMQIPHYSPDDRVQAFLNDYMDIPEGLRSYLRRKARELKLYSDKLTPFQRNNFPEAPADPEGYAAWEKELDAELKSATESAAEKRKIEKVK